MKHVDCTLLYRLLSAPLTLEHNFFHDLPPFSFPSSSLVVLELGTLVVSLEFPPLHHEHLLKIHPRGSTIAPHAHNLQLVIMCRQVHTRYHQELFWVLHGVRNFEDNFFTPSA